MDKPTTTTNANPGSEKVITPPAAAAAFTGPAFRMGNRSPFDPQAARAAWNEWKKQNNTDSSRDETFAPTITAMLAASAVASRARAGTQHPSTVAGTTANAASVTDEASASKRQEEKRS